jgi:acyl carrier protein
MIEKARQLIAEHLDVPQPKIVEGASFRELGADSLDLVSLTMAFEEAFDLHIPDDQAESCETVADAFDLLKERSRLRPMRRALSAEMADARG